MGWLPSHRVVRMLASDDELTTTLSRLASPADDPIEPMVVIIPADRTGRVYYTIEARKYAGEDPKDALPCEGVVIHRIDERNLDREASLQKHPSPHGKAFDAAWLPGETFRDPTGKIAVSVLRATPNGYEVRCSVGR